MVLWLLGLAVLIVIVGAVLIHARRERKQAGYTLVAVERLTEYSK
jgi:cytochrome c-type biogenesis protein CcmH/NrfF